MKTIGSQLKRGAKRTLGYEEILSRLEDHTRKIDEALFFVHRLKNGLAIKTGEFEALTTLFTGQKIFVDTRDISVAPHLMLDGVWEQEITNVWQKIVKEGDTVLDVGANFGFFGIVAGAQIGKNGRLVFVEANSLLVPYIKKSLAVNGLALQSQVYNVAASDKESTIELTILDGYMGSSSVLASNPSNLDNFHTKIDHMEKVRATTIDKLCKESDIKSVDVLKIDIEGYEDVAYKGMKDTIKNSPDLKILLEFTDAAYKNADKFFNTLKDDFAHIYALDGDKIIPVKSYKEVERLSGGDWLMLMLSKKPIS